MAPGSRFCHSPCQNPLNPADDTLVDDLPGAPTKNNGSLTSTSRVFTPGPAPAPVPIVAPISAQTSAILSTNDELSKQFIKPYLEAQTQPPTPTQSKPYERLLKACFFELYLGNSHLVCYKFCQQGEDYFNTAKVTDLNQIPFSASFLRDTISCWWIKYKFRH